METNPKIYRAIANVMADVGAVAKGKKNTQGASFMYRGIDDVMNALNPAMAKHKIFVVPEILEQIREDRTTAKGYSLIYSLCKIKYTFYTDDGSNVSATVIGEAMDSGDKATNKSMSVAFKYACFQVFCIPTEEMQDPDGETHELGKKKETKPSSKANNNQTRPKEPTDAEIAAGQQKIASQKIGQAKINTIRKELERTSVNEMAICKRYKVETLENITEELFIKVMNALAKTKSKE